MPTGGGKTRIASSLLSLWMQRPGKAAWLTHRKELAGQTCRVLGENGVLASSMPEWSTYDPAPARNGEVAILMAQTVARRNHFEGVWDSYNESDLLIIDEAHHAAAAGWERAIKQWPGRVLGLTATPWRLTKSQGFEHLFHCLILGPQNEDMQNNGWLADAQVLMPTPDELILGGELSSTGDFSGIGIDLANQNRPNVMTGSALKFWQEKAQERQTIVYAVTKDHSHNLNKVFNDSGISAAAILDDTPIGERTRAIEAFREGSLRVLINVAVAAEGFDLPDAACVVLTRPTMSLALYLQMVGRGLRPKPDKGNCLLLDLAGNVERHGLPNSDHQWSLKPRGDQGDGDAPPVVRCPDCDGVSPAASHYCHVCESPFGKRCQRCGNWRVWKRWKAELYCADNHDWVCDLCHPDAHTLANLPEGLKKAACR